MAFDSTSIEPRTFVHTPQIDRILVRGVAYLQAGLPLHFRGRAGTGKTTLASMTAQSMDRPVVILYGNDDYMASDLLGERVGYRRRIIDDNYIHNVRKTEDVLTHRWVDSRLAEACKEGWVLIYDEFNRSRAETNNTLLSILEEHLLDYPTGISRSPVPVHEDFRAVLTSNPDEYAGAHPAQDALLDRMITISLDCFDAETELAIAVHNTKAKPKMYRPLIAAVRRLRESGSLPNWLSLRTSIMLVRLVTAMGVGISWGNEAFRDLFTDVILGHLPVQQAKTTWPIIDSTCQELLP